MTDSTSMGSLHSIAASTSNHGSLGGNVNHGDSRDLPKPLKKRPVARHTNTECSLSTDAEDNSSSEETNKMSNWNNNTISLQGKKRSHLNMCTTIDDVHGEPGYFSLTLVRYISR